jgi:hypothetical protein
MMKLFCLILCKCTKLRLHLVKSKLILFKEYTHLTHLHGLILKGRQPFWVLQLGLCPTRTLYNYSGKFIFYYLSLKLFYEKGI